MKIKDKTQTCFLWEEVIDRYGQVKGTWEGGVEVRGEKRL